VHDCFTITEDLDIEDLGFVDKGKGGIASLEGETSLTGRIRSTPRAACSPRATDRRTASHS